jgi:hypothetical protein
MSAIPIERLGRPGKTGWLLCQDYERRLRDRRKRIVLSSIPGWRAEFGRRDTGPAASTTPPTLGKSLPTSISKDVPAADGLGPAHRQTTLRLGRPRG